MTHQGTDALDCSQQRGPSTTANFSFHLHNGSQAAGRIAQGQSCLNSNETNNSTNVGIDTPANEDTGDIANNTETEVVPQTPNSKKLGEMDSGFERHRLIDTPADRPQHNLRQLKRGHSEDRDVNSSAMKQLCFDSNTNYKELATVASHLVQLLRKQKILIQDNTEQVSTSGINRRSDGGPITYDQSPKQSKVGYAQHGASDEALPGTSSHPLIRRSDALAGGELRQWRKAGGDVPTMEKLISFNKNNDNENGHERTARCFASLQAIDNIQRKTAPTPLHSSESNAPPEHLEQLNTLDLSKEYPRRMTFVNWRHRSSVSFTDTVANSGLYFLGNGDRTRCHFCNCILENWHPDDNVAEKHENMSPDCKMVLESKPGYSGDVEQSGCLPVTRKTPAHQNMCLENSRLKTFSGAWPIKSSVEVLKRLAKAGFYYSGQEDHLICSYCNISLKNWAPGLDPWEEHAKWFPNCEFLLEEKGPNFVQQHHASWEPCLFWEDIQDPTGRTNPIKRNCPVNPEMILEKSRLRSFVAPWPTNTLPTSTLFAKAGFFYAGEEDYCICWYCNCALRNWGFSDDPSKEHAKWFPNCEFLLDRNGLKFVKDHHTSRRPVHYQDPQENEKMEKEYIDELMTNCPHVQRARNMGISMEIIRDALKSLVSSGKRQFSSAEHFIAYLFKTGEQETKEKASREEQINELVRNCPGYEMAIKLGIAEDKIRQLMETRVSMGKGQYESLEDFQRDIWKLVEKR